MLPEISTVDVSLTPEEYQGEPGRNGNKSRADACLSLCHTDITTHSVVGRGADAGAVAVAEGAEDEGTGAAGSTFAFFFTSDVMSIGAACLYAPCGLANAEASGATSNADALTPPKPIVVLPLSSPICRAQEMHPW